MHHGVELLGGEHFLDLLAVGQLRLGENGGGRHGGSMSLLKIVKDDYAMAALEQHLRADTSNVSGASGHKNIQRDFSILETWERRISVYSLPHNPMG
jgi:hypothetical protein